MSEPGLHDIQHPKAKTRPAVARTRLRKLEGATVAALLTSSAAASLPVCALGAIPALCRYLVGRDNLAQLGSSMEAEEANEALLRRGLARADLDFVLSSLTAAGLLSHAQGRLCIPLFDAELDEYLAKFANRSAGREKLVMQATRPTPRVAEEQAVVPAVEPSASAQQTLLPKVDETELEGLTQQESKVKAKKQQLRRGQNNRFGPTDGVAPADSDPTVVRILCECGGYAEITQAYIDHLKLAFRGIDVIDALRRAALWCDGQSAKRKTMAGVRRFVTNWLNNQSRDADVRAAVVRANSQRNGFGQGGGYAAVGFPIDALQETQAVAQGLDLDFADLTAEDQQPTKVLATQARVEPTSVATRVSPVARARARAQVATGGRPSVFHQPTSRQLRLSEQRS